MKRLIRPARPDDFPTLVAIDQSCFEENVAYDVYELRYFMSQPSAVTLVAEVDGTIAGFLLFETQEALSGATLVTLDVLESYRNAGIGSQLLDRSEKMLQSDDITGYVLQVDTTNRVALRFYRRHGFRVVQTLRRYYPNGADAYFMKKQAGKVTRDFDG